MTSLRQILVLGASGKQGGALISALLSKPNQPFQILAVTRNKSSSTAQNLAKKPNVKVIEGDFNNVDAIFQQIASPLWGIFIMTYPLKGVKLEEKQGKDVVNAAVAAGVKHVVFTSTDRGGQGVSDNNPTAVPHFASKYNIEQLIIQKTQEQQQQQHQPEAKDERLSYTFLRPVAFYENLSRDFLGKAFISMWRLNGPTSVLQLVNTTDIGKIAADAFLNASSPDYNNKAISLAGDELSLQDLETVFKEETGETLPETFGLVGRALRFMLGDLGAMFEWFRSDGFGVDVKALRGRYPFLTDFRTWIRTESAWKEKKESVP